MENSCIVNASNGFGWYPRGSERLERSLIYHGCSSAQYIWTNWPNDNYDKSCPYNVKAAAIEEVIKKGMVTILWLDCSIWALKNPDQIFNMINDEGVLMLTSGYNSAQTCSDKCLEYFGVTRDEAENMPDASTNCFGFNYHHPVGKEFADRWLKAAKDGVFLGSREHDGQSSDPRFMFHRQDQSAASIICGQMGIKMHTYGEYAMYYQPVMDEKIIFTLGGL